MGIALHPKLLVKENQIFTLCMFFAVLFVVPFSIVCCCLRGSNISSNGVCGETLKVFHSCIDIEVADQDMPGLFAASVEAEPVNQVWPVTGPPKSAAEVQTKVFPQSVLAAAEPRISCPFSDPSIRRGTAVLWAHMWRLHPFLARSHRPVKSLEMRRSQAHASSGAGLGMCTPLPVWRRRMREMQLALQGLQALKMFGTRLDEAELTGRLMHLPKLGRAAASTGKIFADCSLDRLSGQLGCSEAMTSIAAHGEGDRSGVSLSAGNGLAMDFDDSPLLQLPHVRSVPANPPTLREVVESCGEASLLRRIGNFSAEQAFTEQLQDWDDRKQVLDIQAFCRHAPLVELSYVVEVNDEPDMAEGDLGVKFEASPAFEMDYH
ncbi:hypothetical protein AK812_SmicGene39645 [Symbiodinium microadriaticum]|uniref:Uncharacterized protein n=1 Tax=Symbiodinium microadriaticum TaxID=2951 RepID=A0A1Q9CAR6_SYMMI|nr:hypothetical protein AK812_SmicGene39645 [Symbiodinium microadriaticum]